MPRDERKRRRVTLTKAHALTNAPSVASDQGAIARDAKRDEQMYDFSIARARADHRASGEALRHTPKSAKLAAWMECARARAVKRVRGTFRAECEKRKLEAPPQLALERWRFATKLAEDARSMALETPRGKQKRARRGACGIVGEGDAVLPRATHDGAAGSLALDVARAGVARDEAIAVEVAVHRASALEVDKLEKMKQKYVDGGAEGLKKLASATMVVHKRSRDLSLDGCFVKITHVAYEKLRTLHENYALRGDGKESGEGTDLDTFHDRVFALLLRYKTIHGHGFQAACSPEVFRVLHKTLKVTMECFASPLNTFFATHCSAFGDVDGAFGSIGSFASFKPTRGAFEVNPPFVPSVLNEAAAWCESLLDRAEKAKQPLTFVFVMPGWKETRAFEVLTASAFLRASVLIAASDHGYCDGASHQRRDPYRSSPYDTCVFVLRTQSAALDDVVRFAPDAFDAELRVAMRVAVPTAAESKRQRRPLAVERDDNVG